MTVDIFYEACEHFQTLKFSTSESKYLELPFLYSMNRTQIESITLLLDTTDSLVEVGSKNTVSITGELCQLMYMQIQAVDTLVLSLNSIVLATPEFLVNITEIGSNTAGENYTLNCTVISETSLRTTIKWFSQDDRQENRDEVSNSSTRTIINTPSYGLLSFSPLYQSHSGNYTCSVTTGTVGQELASNFEITVISMDCMHRIR